MIYQNHHLTRAIALALALGAIIAPAASADPPPLRKAEAAIAASQRTAPPPVLPNPDEQVPNARPESVIVRVTAPSAGFDWGDAGVGAGVTLALTLIGVGGVLAVTRRRSHRVLPAPRANPQGQQMRV